MVQSYKRPSKKKDNFGENQIVIIPKQQIKINRHFQNALSLMSEEILMKKLENKLESGLEKGGGSLMSAPILKKKIDHILNKNDRTDNNEKKVESAGNNIKPKSKVYSVVPEQEVVVSRTGDKNENNVEKYTNIRGNDKNNGQVVVIANGDV